MNVWGRALLLAMGLLLMAAGAGAETTLTWHGHAAFQSVTPNGAVLLIDPWLTNPVNPKVKNKKDPLADLKEVEYILITHGHVDQLGDDVEIAKKTCATMVTD